jgi:hypothetical protein
MSKLIPGSVVVGYCRPRLVEGAFSESLLATVMRDGVDSGGRQHPRTIINVLPIKSSANVSAARNAIVEGFLASPGEWLWMLDTDMVFEPHTLGLLMAAADPVKAPIVGGLCFGLEADGSLYPTLYAILPDDASPVARYHAYPANELMRVDATGAACILMHRSVLEAIRERAGTDWSPVYPWYQEREHVSEKAQIRVSEDITFCLRAGACGFPVYVHTGIEIGHMKEQMLTAELYGRTQQPEEAPE